MGRRDVLARPAIPTFEQAPCERPDADTAATWMPAVPSAEGLCAVAWHEDPRPQAAASRAEPAAWKVRLRPPQLSPKSCAPLLPAKGETEDARAGQPVATLGRPRPGYCEATPDSRMNDGSEAGDCQHGNTGSWPLLRSETGSWEAASRTCAAMCAHCTRCRFVSYSLKFADCSWFHECSLERLQAGVQGFRSARLRSVNGVTRRVKAITP